MEKRRPSIGHNVIRKCIHHFLMLTMAIVDRSTIARFKLDQRCSRRQLVTHQYQSKTLDERTHQEHFRR